MAERRPVHQQFPFRSGLEAGGAPFNPPLLPYEKSLIQAIGCSEEEYRELVRHAMLRQRVRPAEYNHIPEVNAEITTAAFLTQLAIGLVLTGVSMLLAPKAPSLESGKIKGKKLADQIGPTRFNQATNFDNVSSLAELSQPIPIPFGKRGEGADGLPTGGIILAPALVWSRLYAYGAYQAYEGVYVAGEFGVDEPDLGGILLGTAGLNALSDNEFALYWSSVEGNNRPATLLYGTQGPGATGTVGREVFTAPTRDGQFSDGFSMAYTPSGDTTFGTSSPIHNGTAYRFNWEIVSAPFASTKGSDNRRAGDETRAKRRKIAGTLADVLHTPGPEAGQPGVGREYSRHMGFVIFNGASIENRSVRTVAVGNTAVFEIDHRDGEYKGQSEADFSGTEVNLDDLINSAKGWRERASDLLVVGTTWIIGASSWVVKTKTQVKSDKGVLEQEFIEFECVEIHGVPQIGIPGRKTVEKALGGYDGGTFNPEKHCGPNFFTVCRQNIATIRPVRRDAQVIELGIRSQVWNRASGLCNFNAIPSATKLFELDEDDMQLSTPRMDKYFKRSSCFSLFVRPVKEYGQAQAEFVRIPMVFCVQGSAPINQHNYLRIRPITEAFYEYRLIPRTGSDISINSIDENEITVLDSTEGIPYTNNALGQRFNTAYGEFQITTQGRKVAVRDILRNPELFTDPGDLEAALSPNNVPTEISVTSVSTDSGNPYLRRHAFLTQYLGLARENPGETKTAQQQVVLPGGRSVTVEISATSIIGKLGTHFGQMYLDANSSSDFDEDSRSIWFDAEFTIVNSNGNFQKGDTFDITKGVNNVFSRHGSSIDRFEGRPVTPYSSVTFSFVVTDVGAEYTEQLQRGERAFEEASQVADCSHYTELTKSNDSGPEHEVVYVNEYISNESLAQYNGMSTIGFTVKSTGEVSDISQLRLWAATGIPVTRLIEGDNKPSNLFADLVFYLLSNKTQGVGNVVPSELIDEDSLRTTARFLRANRIFYDGVLEDSESFRSFLYDNAALQLCNFTIKNGRFGMQPALPFDSSHKISLEPIQVEQIFTAGNIIEDSLQLQYIDVSSRSNIQAVVTWRVTVQNDLPYQATALMHWSDLPINERAATKQAFDLSEFCTNREQALKTARFLLSTRRRITKTVSFQTVPDALGVQPGSYIRVITEASTYNSTANGSITDAGTLVSITSIADGTYNALIYKPSTSEVIETELTIASNQVSDSSFHGSLFTLLGADTDYSVYQIESLNLEEDGLVSISAVEVPTDASGVSIVAKDVLTPGNFTVLE